MIKKYSFLILLSIITLSAIVTAESPKFLHPVPGFDYITSDTGGYGCTKDRKKPHEGIDIGDKEARDVEHASVVASLPGTVIFASEGAEKNRFNRGYGNLVIIDHGNDWETRYGHLENFSMGIATGVYISAGQLIGRVGSSGRSTGPHLHFEILYKGEPQDPALIILLSTGIYLKGRGDGHYCGTILADFIVPEKYLVRGPGGDHPDETYDVSTTIGSVTFPISDYDSWLINLYTPLAIKKNKQGLLTKFRLREIGKEISEYIDNLPVDSSPDETYLQSLYSEAQSLLERMPLWSTILEEFNSTPDISILNHGYSDSFYSFVFNKLSWEPIRVREVDFVSNVTDNPILIIPTGGLYGLDSSSTFRQNLADYVQNGGTLVCFAQQHGYEFNALPGGEVSGYGWNEDQSCHTNAAYIDTYHPMFSGQESANLDADVDGYFMTWPDNATILLRRTKNGMPAMIAYPYGNGWVVASSLYSDWSYAHGGMTGDELNLVRDLISWAKNPDKEIKEYKPGDTVNISIPVTNHTDIPSDTILLTLLDPDRNVVDTTEVTYSLSPGQSAETPFSYTASLPLGIWWVNYSLQDGNGNTIQPETEGERFQVSYHYVGGEIDEGYQIWAVAPAEQVVAGTEVPFTIYVKNNKDTDFTGDIAVYSEGYRGSISGISVLAHTQQQYAFSTWVSVSTRFLHRRFYFALFDQPQDYETIHWRNYCVAYAEKVVTVIWPQVDTNVVVDKEIYGTGEEVQIEVGLRNKQEVDYSAELKVIVVDPENIKIFEESQEVNLLAGGSVSESTSLVLSTGSARGIYVVRVEASRNGEIIGSGSTYFEVLRPILRVTPTIPDTFSLSSPNKVSFLVENVGLGDVSDGKLEVVLEDPEKNGVWSETRDFVLPAGKSTNFDFLVSLNEVKFGDYRLINRITTEGRPTSSGSVAIPCSVSTQVSFDKLLYKTRESLNLNLEVTNSGKFEELLEIILNIPTCNFTQSKEVTLLPNESTKIPYSLTIPDTAPAGTNSVEVSLKMANTFTRTFSFAIQSSKLVLSLDKLEYVVEDSGEIGIENQGGVDTDYDYIIKIGDLKGVVVSEQSGTASIQWGTSQTIGFSLASSQIVDGEYLLSCLVNEEKLNKKTLFERYIKVKGLTASLIASTDKKTYFKGEPVGTSAKITPSGGTISDGSLNLKIYSREEKWHEYPDLKGTTYIVPEDGIVWFGTVSGKLIKYDKAKGDWATYSLPSDGIYGNYVYCLAVDVNYVWVGTRSGLTRWDKAGKSWKVYTPAQGLSNVTVISLANDGNYLWVGTAWGLNRMDKINETFQYYTMSDGLVDNQVRSIAVDGNFVWIGSLNGVGRFNKVDGTWQTFTKDNGLVDNRVRAIIVEESYVWFATEGGVSRFEKETSGWKTFTVGEGLVSNDVYSIGLDGTYVWFGTYEGLSRFDRVDNSWKTFTTEDGLASNFVRIIVVDGYEIWFIAGEIS